LTRQEKLQETTERRSLVMADRFAGCLVGQALGDALGFVVEGQSSKYCRRYLQETVESGLVVDSSRGPYYFGQYSDDTQLARELMQSYVAKGKFDPEDYARRIAAIFGEERIVGRGQATEQAARRLLQGVPWHEAGTPPPAAGNGSAMRAAPIGLFYDDEPRSLIEASHNQGVITHRDARCSAGAVAISGAVAQVVQGEFDTSRFLPQLAEWTEEIDPSFAGELRRLAQWTALSPEEVYQHISRAGLGIDHVPDWQGISPFVVSSVLWSLYSFLRSPEDYWETVRTAIAAGGDVDTTAAMAGAISGAYLGLDAVPRSLAKHLNDRGSWGFRDLVDLARKCHAVKNASN
jgi:ADP-ribosylglycohydrolase